MEVELKYLIPDRTVIDSLWQEATFEKYGTVDSVDETDMLAVYYDTRDRLLGSVNAAFRIRKEGPHTVATLKWGGHQHGGLYEREELNIQLPDSERERPPALDVFAESEKGRELIEIIGDKKLIEMISTDFVRRSMKVDTGGAICEAALDVGQIVTPVGNLDICELEIELYSGDLENARRMGDDLAERFGLTPGVESKYGRGIKLLMGQETR